MGSPAAGCHMPVHGLLKLVTKHGLDDTGIITDAKEYERICLLLF